MDTAAEELMNKTMLLVNNPLITTDEYLTDQLLIFMALADGTSRIACNDLSLHSQTIIELLRLFIPGIEITVDPIDDKNNQLVTVRGVGMDVC